MGELDGLNIYVFVDNDAIDGWDIHGLVGRRAGDPPWNQRADVAQGFDVIELTGFDVMGGGVLLNVGGCCDRGRRRFFAKAQGIFGLGVGGKWKSIKIKQFQAALKKLAKGKALLGAIAEFDKQCPRDGFDFDVRVDAQLLFIKAYYSFLGDILNLLPSQGTGHGTGSITPEIGWGAEASIQLRFGWVWVFDLEK